MNSRTESRDRPPGTLLVVGGGRWARVYLSILAGLDLPFAKIVIVSSHGGDRLAALVARSAKFILAPDLDEALNAGPVAAAIVANTARAHVPTTLRLLRAHIPVLVEKPTALREDEAARLIEAARDANMLLMPGHVLRHCAYLQNFAAALQTLEDIRSVRIFWRDAQSEARYGEAKAYDTGLGAAEDIGPHITTILSVLFQGQCDQIAKTTIRRGGLAVEAQGLWKQIPFTLALEREGANRQRLIVVTDRSGKTVQLDFSGEPGLLAVDGVARSADPDWQNRPSPLTLQLQAFLAAAPAPDERMLQEIETSTRFTAQLAQSVRAAQQHGLEVPSGQSEADQIIAMREWIAPRLIEAEGWTAGDQEGLANFASQALHILRSRPAPLDDIVRQICSGAVA